MSDMSKKLADLEKRIEELERRPVYYPQPVWVWPPNYSPPAPYWHPWWSPVCGTTSATEISASGLTASEMIARNAFGDTSQ